MVTKATTKSAAPAKKVVPPKKKAPGVSAAVREAGARERGPRDFSPKWDIPADWAGDKFTSHFRSAMRYYNMNHSGKDLKHNVIEWMGKNAFTKTQIAAYKKTKDWRTSVTTGAIASCLLRGMPPIHEEFNQGRNTNVWLHTEIETIIENGKHDIEVIAPAKALKTAVVVTPNIQDRIKEMAGEMSEEIDAAIDLWITDPEEFDPKAFKLLNLLRGKGAKAAHSRYIKGFFQRSFDDLLELASGKADEQLREAYKHNSRKNVKKLIEFYQSIMAACDQIAAEAKVMKKPRAAKVKPAEELVKKIKFKKVDDKLGIASVPAAGIIGAQAIVVYNTKYRKIGYYIAKNSAGLNVKGASIIDFTDKSVQKTLRKPAEQLKEFKDQNTQKRVETWFGKIKSMDTVLNGRINEEIMILKVYK